MYLCSNVHEEIVYAGPSCPLCESKQETEEAEMKIADLEKELEEATAEAAECAT